MLSNMDPVATSVGGQQLHAKLTFLIEDRADYGCNLTLLFGEAIWQFVLSTAQCWACVSHQAVLRVTRAL